MWSYISGKHRRGALSGLQGTGREVAAILGICQANTASAAGNRDLHEIASPRGSIRHTWCQGHEDDMLVACLACATAKAAYVGAQIGGCLMLCTTWHPGHVQTRPWPKRCSDDTNRNKYYTASPEDEGSRAARKRSLLHVTSCRSWRALVPLRSGGSSVPRRWPMKSDVSPKC
jgi:hypothetical protein